MAYQTGVWHRARFNERAIVIVHLHRYGVAVIRHVVCRVADDGVCNCVTTYGRKHKPVVRDGPVEDLIAVFVVPASEPSLFLVVL